MGGKSGNGHPACASGMAEIRGMNRLELEKRRWQEECDDIAADLIIAGVAPHKTLFLAEKILIARRRAAEKQRVSDLYNRLPEKL